MFENFGLEITKLFKEAEEERFILKHPYVGSEHLLLAILKSKDQVVDTLKQYNLTYDKFRKELIKVVGSATKGSELNLYTPLLKRVILNALDDAKENNNGLVTINHLLLAMLEEGEGIAIRLLVGMDVDLDGLYKELHHSNVHKSKLEIYEIGTLLNEYVSLSESVVGRNNEIEIIIETLLRKKKNNPLLVGKAGVGKTAIIEELTRMIINKNVPEELQDKKIISLEMGSLVAGTKYRGEFEEKLTKIIKEIINEKNIILFIDEIHTMVNAGGAEGAINASDILKPYLARGDIKCIGATTVEEYNKFIAKDKALERRFEYIFIEEPDADETKEIIRNIKTEYENHHNITISEENINDIVSLSNKYIHNKNNPDKAIDLLDTVCAKVKNKTKEITLINKLKIKLDNITKEKEKCVLLNDFDKALTLRKEEIKLKDKIENIIKNRCLIITKEDILKVIENKSNIPILEDKELIFNAIKNNLNKNIIGQKAAIKKILSNLKVKLNGTNKPLSLLLVGPTGVGKTETVKVIAQSLSKKSKLIRLDMSEYNLETSVNKLIGTSAGYIGYDDECVFKQVKLNPYSIILVDEIEKAHPKVLNLFLQILDEGFITDSKGEKIYFENTCIFMTSNVVNNIKMGFSNSSNNNIEEILTKEIIGRFNDVIEFVNIDEAAVREYLKKLNLDNNLNIEKIIAESEFEKYGLRNVKNIIAKYQNFQIN
ncbi:MAG: ATP-dependent Clp protease ATP-binding subunit [Bacilli bacterium]|nr:ATP-dependent Clp protease ATP-binding subunit [Bacilli bacterium]